MRIPSRMIGKVFPNKFGLERKIDDVIDGIVLWSAVGETAPGQPRVGKCSIKTFKAWQHGANSTKPLPDLMVSKLDDMYRKRSLSWMRELAQVYRTEPEKRDAYNRLINLTIPNLEKLLS